MKMRYRCREICIDRPVYPPHARFGVQPILEGDEREGIEPGNVTSTIRHLAQHREADNDYDWYDLSRDFIQAAYEINFRVDYLAAAARIGVQVDGRVEYTDASAGQVKRALLNDQLRFLDAAAGAVFSLDRELRDSEIEAAQAQAHVDLLEEKRFAAGPRSTIHRHN